MREMLSTFMKALHKFEKTCVSSKKIPKSVELNLHQKYVLDILEKNIGHSCIPSNRFMKASTNANETYGSHDFLS